MGVAVILGVWPKYFVYILADYIYNSLHMKFEFNKLQLGQ